MHRRSRAKWRLSLVDGAKEVLEPLDRARDPLRLSARVEGIERGDRSMQQCPDARFVDLGADFHDRLHPQRRTRQLIRELEHLSGKTVTLHDAA
jgi:hypothetical protein